MGFLTEENVKVSVCAMLCTVSDLAVIEKVVPTILHLATQSLMQMCRLQCVDGTVSTEC